MYKKGIAVVFFLTFFNWGMNKAFGQEPVLHPLPMDTAIRTGKLANGFTWFIRRNREPEHRVTLYLVNKVGSVLEEDNQQGLAHFMEHMNFNGTVHYPRNELVDYLQKAGVRFGADLNAFTSFDETIYQLPIPSDDSSLLRNGFQIMRDWAKGALLDPVEIDKERGVVLEEGRLGKGAGDRMMRSYLPVLLNGSRYAQRLPIGTEEVLRNFQPVALRDFYDSWYRPDLQALVVVGDIQPDSIERIIRMQFGDLVNPQGEKPRVKYAVELSGKNHYTAVTDKEMAYTDIQYMIKRKGYEVKTEADYRGSILEYLFNRMMQVRMGELKRKVQIPFQDGTANINPFFSGVQAFTMEVIPKNGEVESGFKAVCREVERVRRYGFTTTELERAKTEYIRAMERTLIQKDKLLSDFYADDYVNFFLTGAVPMSAEVKFQLSKKLMASITVKDIAGLMSQYAEEKDRDILIQAPEKEKLSLPGEAVMLKWKAEVRREKLSLYRDDTPQGQLLGSAPVRGHIVGEDSIAGLGVKRWTLNNGAVVLLKPTTFANDQIVLDGTAPGGLLIYRDQDYLSASFADRIVSSSGVGRWNPEQLSKYLAGRQAAVEPQIGERFVGIKAFTHQEDLETSLQLLYLYFLQPRNDSGLVASMIAHVTESLKNKPNEPENLFADSVNAILYGHDFRYSPLTLDKLRQVDVGKAYQMYKDRFADASGFTFVFTGNLDTAALRPLVEKYLASLPSLHRKEEIKASRINYAQGDIRKTVYSGLEDKAAVRLIFAGEYNGDDADNQAMDALGEVLEIRLLERLREEESGVYSPSVNFSYDKPAHRYSFNISFGCSPHNVDTLIHSTLSEIAAIKTAGPLAVNLEKYKAETGRGHELQLKSNGFWENYLVNKIRNGGDLMEVNAYERIMAGITCDRIRELADNYLVDSNLFQFVLLPEKDKPSK